MTLFRYKAFISYSHADEKWGDWLHRALETYSVPAKLVGRETGAGPIPKRLTPIFRDREDLPAAGNLNATILAALKDSQFLVVISSPNSAQSKWVGEEIRNFKAFHGSDRILTVIVDGEPFSGDPATEAFPERLRFDEDETGARLPGEPLAADARDEKDGKQAAISKLVAGLIGVPLDDLVQREAQRRARRTRVIVGTSLSLAAIMGMLSVYAFDQRGRALEAQTEAELQRAEAEGLIDFMITDVREEAEQVVGKLGTLEILGDRALEYYAGQDLSKLDADALGRRARALQFSGAVDQNRNDLTAALSAYEEASATTAELLRRFPDDAQRIYDHAQSVFYVGDIAYRRSALATAEENWTRYRELADQLIEIEPENSDYQLEVAYSNSNLGALAMAARNYERAGDFYTRSMKARKKLYDQNPNDARITRNYARALSNIARMELARGDFRRAQEVSQTQIDLYNQLSIGDAENFRLLYDTSIALRRFADASLFLGETDRAFQYIENAALASGRLVARDPQNTQWRKNSAYIDILRSQIAHFRADHAQELAFANFAAEHALTALTADGSDGFARIAYIASLARKAETEKASANVCELLSSQIEALSEQDISVREEIIATAATAVIKNCSQTRTDAQLNFIKQQAFEVADRADGPMPVSALLSLYELYATLRRNEEAEALRLRLQKIGVQHPRFASQQSSP